MVDTRIAEVINTGGSQSVLIPADFHIHADQVLIRRNEATGDLILSPSESSVGNWRAFFDLMETIDVPEDFMADRPMNTVSVARGVFDNE